MASGSKKSCRASRSCPVGRPIPWTIGCCGCFTRRETSCPKPPLGLRLRGSPGGAEPLICVNKMDLLAAAGDAESELARLRPYRELGIRVIPCSASDGHGIDGLLQALAGKLCVFVGHSGVGKSSLLNAIHPELNL